MPEVFGAFQATVFFNLSPAQLNTTESGLQLYNMLSLGFMEGQELTGWEAWRRRGPLWVKADKIEVSAIGALNVIFPNTVNTGDFIYIPGLKPEMNLKPGIVCGGFMGPIKNLKLG